MSKKVAGPHLGGECKVDSYLASRLCIFGGEGLPAWLRALLLGSLSVSPGAARGCMSALLQA